MRAWLTGWLFSWFSAACAQAPVRIGPPEHRLPVPAVVAVPEATAAALQGLASQAEVIFLGRVVAVDRHDGSGFVDVTFAIETAIRGCGAGSKYTLREWAGLWQSWPDRYEVGQRRLMLLTARGPSGMSSPVGGMSGIIPVVGTRQPPLMNGAGRAPAESPGEQSEDAADLRWVQLQAVRPLMAATASLRSAGATPDWRGPIQRLPVLEGPEVAGPSLTAVLGLLAAENGSRAR